MRLLSVHEVDDGRDVWGERSEDLPARTHQHELHDRGHGAGRFTAVQSGTFFYHSHDHVDRQQALGLYGAMIIDPTA
jgi:hypothetical protein